MKKKILVVDDAHSILDALSIILGKKGYDVETNLNGRNLFKDGTYRPDLILLDIMLSGMNGLDICRGLKKKEETKDIPIIIISSLTNKKEEAEEAGAEAFIEKPFIIANLLEKIENFL